jgi:hypothetical protein
VGSKIGTNLRVSEEFANYRYGSKL